MFLASLPAKAIDAPRMGDIRIALQYQAHGPERGLMKARDWATRLS
jgi:hypothetical protein